MREGKRRKRERRKEKKKESERERGMRGGEREERRRRKREEEGKNEVREGRSRPTEEEFNDGDMHIAAPFENNEHFRRNSALFMPVVFKLAAC